MFLEDRKFCKNFDKIKSLIFGKMEGSFLKQF